MDNKMRLLQLIGNLLHGEEGVQRFRERYYDFYLEEIPDYALTDRDANFFGSVQEKLDWTDSNPDAESRSYGWINEDEFVQWLREALARFSREKL